MWYCDSMIRRAVLVLENIRSAYNVGNLIRTADALDYDIIIAGYTPHPDNNPRIQKTALGSQNHVYTQKFWNPNQALQRCRDQNYLLCGAEITQSSIALNWYDPMIHNPYQKAIALFVGNEVSGLCGDTLQRVDLVLHIPMRGIKESLNVWQAWAILMRHLSIAQF